MERIPEIKKLTLYLGHITQQAHWVKLIQTVMNHYRNKSTFNPETLTTVRSDLGLSEDVFNHIYTGLYCLVVQIVRNHIRQRPTDAIAAIMDEIAPLGLPEKYAHIFKSACSK